VRACKPSSAKCSLIELRQEREYSASVVHSSNRGRAQHPHQVHVEPFDLALPDHLTFGSQHCSPTRRSFLHTTTRADSGSAGYRPCSRQARTGYLDTRQFILRRQRSEERTVGSSQRASSARALPRISGTRFFYRCGATTRQRLAAHDCRRDALRPQQPRCGLPRPDRGGRRPTAVRESRGHRRRQRPSACACGELRSPRSTGSDTSSACGARTASSPCSRAACRRIRARRRRTD